MQELPSENNMARTGVRFSAGQDNYSRLRKLHVELERVVQRHEQEKASVQRWWAWLWGFCTLGNGLQALCSVAMILSLSQPDSGHSMSNLVTAFILCGSLVLLLWVQHASFQGGSMRLGTRAGRFLSRLEWWLSLSLPVWLDGCLLSVSCSSRCSSGSSRCSSCSSSVGSSSPKSLSIS